MEKIRKNLNKYVIGFLILTITLFGGLSFILDKGFVDRLINYYVIFVSGIGILLLFCNNLNDFRWKNIKKIPLFLTILTMIWLALTFFFGIHKGMEGIKAFINFGCLLCLGFVVSNIQLDSSDKKFILYSIFVSFGLCMIIGIIQYFTGVNLIKYSNALYPGIRGRINSTFFIATILDKYIVLISVVLIYQLWKHPKNHFYQLLYLLSGIGVSLTFSRGGQLVYIFLMAVYFIVALFRKQLSNLIVVLVTFIVMFFIPGTTMSLQSGLNFVYDTLKLPAAIRVNVYDIYSKIDGTVKKWMSPSKNDEPSTEKPSTGKPNGSTGKPSTSSKPNSTFDDDENHSLEFRKFYKKVASQLSEKHPIFGIGVGNYAYIVNQQNAKDYLEDTSFFGWHTSYGYPHNNTAQTVAEVGMIGFVLITITILSYICYLNFKKEILYVFSVLLFVAALYLAGYTEGIYYSKQYIFVFMLIYAFLCAKVKKENGEEFVVKQLFEKAKKCTKKDYLHELSSHLENKERAFVVTANPEAFQIAQNDKTYADILLDPHTDIIADGIGLIKSGKLLGYSFPERIPGVELAEELLKVANQKALKVYLFGSSEEVMGKMKKLVATKYKKIKLVGAENGYVKNKTAVFEDMAKKKPDLVLVALGMPLQEKMIYENLKQFKKGVFIGVGGSFDVISGTKKRAPEFFIKTNLEWLYRIFKEPKRIKRFYDNNVKFLWNALCVHFATSWKPFVITLLISVALLIGIPLEIHYSNQDSEVEQGNNPIILMYHGVRDDAWGEQSMFVTVKDFTEQMQYLKKAGYQTAYLSEIESIPKDEKTVILTFDDGYVDVYENAFPILKEIGFKANVFVIPKYVNSGAYLTDRQIAEMSNSKVFEVGSHSYNHNDLSSLSTENLKKDLSESKKYIENIIHKEVNTLAYPGGKFNQKVLDTAALYYDYAVKTGGNFRKDTDKLSLPRLGIMRNVTVNEFINKIEK